MEAMDTPVFMDVKPCKLISASMVFVPLPQCLYHSMRQGVGRLIRTATDEGIIVILDNRVVTKAYGRAFLRALPECPVEVTP